jgi:hypothetical protein
VRGVEGAASAALNAADANTIAVAHDPGEARAGLLSEIGDVRHVEFAIDRDGSDRGLVPRDEASARDSVKRWLKAWGPALGCLAGTVVLLRISSPPGPPRIVVFPWPDHLTKMPVMTAAGPSNVKLVRSALSTESTAGWRVSGRKLVQPDPAEQSYRACQVEVDVTNLSGTARYVGAQDFSLLDTTGREWRVEPRLVVRLANGLGGKWVGPGETWSGWLQQARGDAPVTGLVFAPDGATRIALRAKQ